MLRLSDFVTGRKRYYNHRQEVYISALEHCRKMKFRTYMYLHLTLINKTTHKQNGSISLCLSSSVRCRRGYYFREWMLYFNFGTY